MFKNLQGAKPFKTCEVLSTLCVRNRATAQINASRIQVWRWSVTKHSSKQSDLELTRINTGKGFSLVLQPAGFFCWRQSQTNTCLLLESDPKSLGLCSVELMNLFRTRHLHPAQGSTGSVASPQSVGWKKCNWLPKKWESIKAGSADTKESMLFHQIAHSSSENLTPAFFNALCWIFNANLYSCQLLFF